MSAVVPGVNFPEAASYLNAPHPHPPLSANRWLSFTMKSTSCSVPGTVAVGHVFQLLRTPVDLRHLGAVGQRLAVAGIAGVIRIDHQGIRQDHSHHLVAGVTYGDNRPAFVSLNSENARPPDTCTVY